jgi:hypothetical protein
MPRDLYPSRKRMNVGYIYSKVSDHNGVAVTVQRFPTFINDDKDLGTLASTISHPISHFIIGLTGFRPYQTNGRLVITGVDVGVFNYLSQDLSLSVEFGGLRHVVEQD